MKLEEKIVSPPFARKSGGYCRACQKDHVLPIGNCLKHGIALMEKMEKYKSLDFSSPSSSNARFSTSSLFGKDRGKMFGVLEGIDVHGSSVVYSAFSGQYDGFWSIPGWAPPLFEEEQWHKTNYLAERRIKELTAEIEKNTTTSEVKTALKRQRKELSQDLMTRLHELYTITNFREESTSLTSLYSEKKGAPTGAGDCCAPKLIHLALRNKVIPLGMVEFFWGRTNPSQSREHGQFYPACVSKCQPLLGFMLCGLEEKYKLLGLIP